MHLPYLATIAEQFSRAERVYYVVGGFLDALSNSLSIRGLVLGISEGSRGLLEVSWKLSEGIFIFLKLS